MKSYVIKHARGGKFFTGVSSEWSTLYRDAARWSTLAAASLVANQLLDRCYVVRLKAKSGPVSRKAGEP